MSNGRKSRIKKTPELDAIGEGDIIMLKIRKGGK